MSNSIEILARGVCLQNNHVLLCKNNARGNVYLPGGHVELGEDSATALAREWQEEIGLSCTVGPLLGVAEQQYDAPGEGPVSEISLVFRAESPDLPAPPAPPPSAEAYISFYWAPLDQIAATGLLPLAIAQALPAWLANPTPPSPLWLSQY